MKDTDLIIKTAARVSASYTRYKSYNKAVEEIAKLRFGKGPLWVDMLEVTPEQIDRAIDSAQRARADEIQELEGLL